MQIEKTLPYNSSYHSSENYAYAPSQARPNYLREIGAWLSRGVKGFFDNLLSGEAAIVRLIIFTTSLACFIFGLTGTEKFYYMQVNVTQAAFGVVMVALTYTSYGKRNIRFIGNLFIYMLDISNATLLATSHFDDKLSYQYIIYFFVSSLFFNSKNSLVACIVLNSVFVFAFSFLLSQNSSSLSDFYITFVASEFGLLLLMLKRFKTEAMLAENESKYRLLAENSADVICTHSPSGEYDFVSPSISALTGYEPAELQGHSAEQFIYPEDRSIYKGMIEHSGSDSVSDTFQYRFLAKNGEYVWLETVIRGLGDEASGNEAGFLSQTRSFQRHREYMEQIQRHTVELQSSYKDLEMFAYISSHDMQEPLRMISNYMQLLRRKYEVKLDKDAMDYIDFAIKGASNLQSLIKDLLSYSTINKKEINLVSVDMDELLNDVLSSLQLLMEDRNAKVFINEPLKPLMADKNALTQLMQNLIQNGMKYNISEVPTVRISCTEDSKFITYCIQDNGIGIEKEYATQIFEPFKRLHNKHNFPGTGLGLSICGKIVDRLNGTIWVDSEPGVGSSFYFSIPKVQPEKQQA